MRDYEILYIVRPELDEDQLNQAIERVNALIANVGGAHQKTDIWGKRRLAYEVDRLREGYYVLTDFQVEPERVPEMESTLKISDTVFRHLIVRKPAKVASGDGTGERPAAGRAEAAGVAPTADAAPAAEAVEAAPEAAAEPAAEAAPEAAPADTAEQPADAGEAEDAEDAEPEAGEEEG